MLERPISIGELSWEGAIKEDKIGTGSDLGGVCGCFRTYLSCRLHDGHGRMVVLVPEEDVEGDHRFVKVSLK
jgi:hypothetical protein